ncbi:hypothetical protein BDB00DRAFT_831326 [Zychaea mexicana]|uniref:uncharacterized protein n=1 Tax=Zychaea mexicana TaxID=64656 RepID=UPI0022FEB712|nr:uncharacterized protein BDB00DRAFT_831326 [Zychaea mexicana]KAI9491755.1 hypothetical protein BDB00DRAFT_831326 [Zychaea mexicana]
MECALGCTMAEDVGLHKNVGKGTTTQCHTTYCLNQVSITISNFTCSTMVPYDNRQTSLKMSTCSYLFFLTSSKCCNGHRVFQVRLFGNFNGTFALCFGLFRRFRSCFVQAHT